MNSKLLNEIASCIVIATGLYGVSLAGCNFFVALKMFYLTKMFLFSPWLYLIPALFGIFAIFVGVFSFRQKFWALAMMLFIGYLLSVVISVYLIFLGELMNLCYIAIILMISAIITWTYNQKGVQELFNLTAKQLKGIHRSNIGHIIGLAIIILGYGYIRFVYCAKFDYCNFIPGIWTIESAVPNDYIEHKVFSVIVKIPKELTEEREGHDSRAFFRNGKGIVMIFNDNNLELLAPTGKLLGEPDGYIFAGRILKDRVGMISLGMRAAMGPVDFYRFDSPRWKGYICESSWRGHEAFIWDKNTKKTLLSMVIMKDKKQEKDILGNIIGSLKTE
jgi:hypothetical protein